MHTRRRALWQPLLLLSGVFLVAVFLTSFLWAQASPAAASDEMLLKSYGTVRSGTYEGVLYCLRHDFSQEKEDQEICSREGAHLHVLLMDDGHVHPLYGRTEGLNKLINSAEMNAKRVKVQGRYYPISNAILVGTVEELGKK